MTWPPGPPGSGTASYNRPSSSLGLPSAVPLPVGADPGRKPDEETTRSPRAGAQAQGAPTDDSIAVLLPAGLRTRGRWRPLDVTSAPQVLATAVELGIRQIWVGPSTAAHLGFPDRFTVPEGTAEPFRYGIPHPWLSPALPSWPASTTPAGLAPWVSLGGPGRWVDLVLPAWDTASPWQASTNGELLEALELYATHVGIRFRRSPGATGIALMRDVHSGPGAVKLPELSQLAPPALEVGSQSRGSWIASIYRVRGWYHAFDLNGMYLAACSSAELGFGPPTLVTQPGNGIGGAGYWSARVSGGSFELEPPFKADGKQRWYTAPAMQFLAELGAKVAVESVWVYPESRRWLEPWYRRLRDARTALLALDTPAAALALRALKDTYAVALGRLAGSWLEPGDPTFRPDWRMVVMDRARANMHRHLAKVHAHAAAVPVAVDADTVVYFSKHDDPIDVAAQLGLELDLQQLGKWKPAGRVRAVEARKAIAGRKGLAALRGLLEALES